MKRTVARGGRLIVPAFAVGRTQQLVLMLHQLMNEKRFRPCRCSSIVRSPLNVTEVFRAHPECFDEETYAYLQERRGSVRIQSPELYPGRERIEEAERHERAVHRDLGIRYVRSGAHPAPSAQQHRGQQKHGAAHRLSG